MIIKNFTFSIFYKILGMIASLVLVPVLISILGVEQYGVWVTLTSLLVWISLFDFGLGYALKNTVTKSLANNKIQNAQSEAYQTLKITMIVSVFMLIIFAIFLFNTEILYENLYLALILFIPFIVFFPFKIGNAILQGARKIVLESGLLFINTALFMISIYTFYLLKLKIELLELGLLFVSSYLISLFLIWIFSIRVIKIKFFDVVKIFNQKLDFQRIKVGSKFFGLQLSSLVLYSMGTIIIFSYLSATQAANFNVVNKIFLFGFSIFSIIIAVFWPEISHNLEKNDFKKMRKLYFIMLFLSFVFTISAFLFSYIVPSVIEIWTNNKIHIKQSETIYFSFLVSVQAMAYSGAVILNAFERINYQLALSLLSTTLMFPIAIYFINHGYGISSIPLAAGLLTLLPLFYCNIHAIKLIYKGLKNG